jgi:ubiquinone/menaquinone biosynthesis C-methylase UbiE
VVEQAHIRRGDRILDLGCGTATLTILIKRTHPGAEVAGLDGDPRILEIARRKAAKEGLEIKLDEGMS